MFWRMVGLVCADSSRKMERKPETLATYLALGGSLDPEPDTQVLSTMQKHQVKALLMGGKLACGTAQRSLAVIPTCGAGRKDNLRRLQEALLELNAERIAVPPFERIIWNEGMLSLPLPSRGGGWYASGYHVEDARGGSIPGTVVAARGR
jgi:hypothetical protein